MFAGWPGVTPFAVLPDRMTTPRPATSACLSTEVDEGLLEVFARANRPDDPMELLTLYLARVEHDLGHDCARPELADHWRESRRRREVSSIDVLQNQATPVFIKELFNFFFRDDLYGRLEREDNILLSTGSVEEERFGLPSALRACVHYALERGWYGYSDSLGRDATRSAIAEMENAREGRTNYDATNVAVTFGGTAAVGSLVELLARRNRNRRSGTAVVGLPNYPPLVRSIGQRFPTELVPLACEGQRTPLRPLLDAIRTDTPLVFIQTVTNPTGARVDVNELDRLLRTVTDSTVVILDDSHDCLGPRAEGLRSLHPNLVRVRSLSKSHGAPGLKVGWILAHEEIVSEFYELASTAYGSPPSLFYLLTEVLARFELWEIRDLMEPGPHELAELAEYEPCARDLVNAYASYRIEREARERELLALRNFTVDRAHSFSEQVFAPLCSFNVTFAPGSAGPDYLLFRRLLRRERVAFYPGILAYCLDGAWLRASPGVQKNDLVSAMDRTERFVRGLR